MAAVDSDRLLAGRYRLGAVIGRGGMGTVWLARDELLKRDVAVKEIVWPPQLDPAEREVARGRAVREAQLAARLHHPNVVTVYDIVEEDGRPCIVMELVPFRSLREVVAEDGPVSPAQAARIGLSVLAALRAVHEAGVVHRDVKPANILLGPENRIVLADFGIAKAADSPALTASGVLVGSPSYLAPERARGGMAGPPADLWALGASLFAAVEGRPPFERDGVLASLTAVVADELDPAPHAGPLRPVIEGLLDKDPATRLDIPQAERMLLEAEAEAGREPAATQAMPAAQSTAEASPADHARHPEPADHARHPEPADHAEPVPPAGRVPLEDYVLPADFIAPAERRDRPGQRPGSRTAAGRSRAARDSRAPSRSRPPRSSRAIAARLIAVAAAVLFAAGLAVAFLRPAGHPPAPRAGSTPSTATSRPSPAGPANSGASSASSASASHPSSSSPSASSTSSASSASSAGQGTGALPAGYYRFTNSTGFSIAVPHGWNISHDGHYVYIRDPGDSGIFLLIDQSDQPRPDPLADWRQQAANRQSSYPGYHLILLRAVRYTQAEKAADWEFTYDRNGVMVRVLNRNILANAQHAYALYWSTPASDWDADYHFFQVFADTFRPAPAT
jgi:eukaryotic-like serine/threonine-protein kinase